MKKAIAGVFVVLGMFLTPGAAVAGLHESTRPECFPLRSSGMFAHACCMTTRVTAGVGGWRSCLMSRLSKIRKKTTNNPTLDKNADVFFMEILEKTEEMWEIQISDKNGPYYREQSISRPHEPSLPCNTTGKITPPLWPNFKVELSPHKTTIDCRLCVPPCFRRKSALNIFRGV